MDTNPVHTHHDRPYAWVGAWSERRAALTPQAPAVTDLHAGRTWTYAALDAQANRTARLLADLGVGPGDRVAVLARNRIAYVDLFLATAKVGAVLAPVSHRLAPPTVADLLGLIDPSTVIVEDRFADLLEASPHAPTIRLADDGDATAPGRPYDAARPADESRFDGPGRALADPHLLLHTGGTTGTPKETVLTHGGILWNSVNTITGWGLRDDDVVPMAFPFFHTGGWNVLTVPMLHMGGHVIIDRAVDPARILAAIEDHGATVFVAVPAVLRSLATHDAWERTDVSSLRFVKSGGGPCRADVIRAWRDRGVELSQGYGLTECGPNNFGMPPGGGAERPDSVGRPMPHVDVRIVDEDGDHVEPNAIGELELASPHAADRYFRNEAETADTFGDGWVSTGDLARMDGDGFVHIEGRKKHMFVSGGENVYPGEVEAAIASHPDVEEVVVLGVPDEDWGEVGLAVLETDADLTLEGLRAHLEDRLARFKHPRQLELVDGMPTSGPDKIDREALRERFARGNR